MPPADHHTGRAVELGLYTGAEVWFAVKAAEVALYPRTPRREVVATRHRTATLANTWDKSQTWVATSSSRSVTG